MPKKLLIVDDSALVRKQMRELVESALDFDYDFAKNGKEAVERACEVDFDVITMDINMPVMDGLTAVKEIMAKNPTPILMLSSLTSDNADTTMDALDFGAIDYVTKPGTMNIGRDENAQDIIKKIKTLSRIPRRRLKARVAAPKRERRMPSEEKPQNNLTSKDISKVVLIGSSTGGPGLIEQICASLPASYPYPVCIVQHMLAQFTEAFAKRLDRASTLPVHHASNNLEVCPGNIYLAKGGTHLHFAKKVSGKIVIHEQKNKGDNFFQPSVDEMFDSALSVFSASNLVGVILTGIGDDGADGMVKVKKQGGYTLGETEESATVYGMPKEAFVRGGVSEQLPFPKILKTIATLK
jgi:two-component system chemotaxis response regulator CheB